MISESSNTIFRWNAGSWFGCQLGATIWLLLAGISIFPISTVLSVLMLWCFLVPNIVGTLMWVNRKRLPPFQSMQVLLTILFTATAIALVGADYLDYPGALDPRFDGPEKMYWILLLYPVLMVALYIIKQKNVTDCKVD